MIELWERRRWIHLKKLLLWKKNMSWILSFRYCLLICLRLSWLNDEYFGMMLMLCVDVVGKRFGLGCRTHTCIYAKKEEKQTNKFECAKYWFSQNCLLLRKVGIAITIDPGNKTIRISLTWILKEDEQFIKKISSSSVQPIPFYIKLTELWSTITLQNFIVIHCSEWCSAKVRFRKAIRSPFWVTRAAINGNASILSMKSRTCAGRWEKMVQMNILLSSIHH